MAWCADWLTTWRMVWGTVVRVTSAAGLCVGLGAHHAGAQSLPGAQATTQLAPLLAASGDINPAWRYVGFPKKQADLPATRFEAATADDNRRAVRVSTARSYGTLVHDWQGAAPGALHWTWRLDQPLSGGKAAPDLTTKAGDDAALKLCVMFDHPLERVPFVERTLLRVARSISSEHLPAATVCYVWDSAQPAGLQGANPYTRRVRYISLRGTEAPLKQWLPERRSPAQDYLDVFKDEVSTDQVVVPVLAVVLGADSDNTGSTSLGWVAQVKWQLPNASQPSTTTP